ncbi:hypothetical protein K1W54_15960, partial [Micromonospora sp. CPCC 205371]|nr:hypothetical protein [Micromonospora sp. CPCC 205371]
ARAPVAGGPHRLVVRAAGDADVGRSVQALFTTGDALGYAGAGAFAAAALAASLALYLRYGPRTLPGALIVLAASVSFVDSHIFWPRGVLTMLAFAAGFALIAAATAATPVATEDAGSGFEPGDPFKLG